MDKLASLWSFVRKHKYLITLALFAVIIGFLDENSVVRLSLIHISEPTRPY